MDNKERLDIYNYYLTENNDTLALILKGVNDLPEYKDLTEELETYGDELNEQNVALEDIVEALKGKVSGGGEPEVEPDYIQDGLIAWWEGCDNVDSDGRWCSRVGDDYIKNASGYSGKYSVWRNAFYTIKKEKAYQNNMSYGLVSNKDYYYEGYTIECVGLGRNGGNELSYDTDIASPLISFDKMSAPMISPMGSNGFFACVNQYQDSGMPKLFTNCYGKRYKYAITLDKLFPRADSSGQCQVSYSLNDSPWYQKALANYSSATSKGNHICVMAFHWDKYLANAEVNSIRIYNRRLTEEELRHNYEIDKARFKLDDYVEESE